LNDNLTHLIGADQVRSCFPSHVAISFADRFSSHLSSRELWIRTRSSATTRRERSTSGELGLLFVRCLGRELSLRLLPSFLRRPTYKYDNGTDSELPYPPICFDEARLMSSPFLSLFADYDSSEKARIPAFTDRVLWRGSSVSYPPSRSLPYLERIRTDSILLASQVEQLVYARVGLRTSDHRPVLGLFKAKVQIIDKEKKAAISAEIKQGLLKQMDGSGDISDGLRSLRVDSFEVDGRELTFLLLLLSLRFASASLFLMGFKLTPRFDGFQSPLQAQSRVSGGLRRMGRRISWRSRSCLQQEEEELEEEEAHQGTLGRRTL